MKFLKDNWWFVALVIIALVLFGFMMNSDKSNNPPREVIQVMFDINDPFSEIKVRKYLNDLNVRYVDVAIAQMKLESATGTSKIFREGNNLFGMKHPRVRPTTSLGVKNNHAYYSHWRQSCVDYALFQAYVMDLDNSISEDAWLDYIGRVYAEDTEYTKKLLKIKNDARSNHHAGNIPAG